VLSLGVVTTSVSGKIIVVANMQTLLAAALHPRSAGKVHQKSRWNLA